ncbi:MAG: hypothetical protein AAFW01_09620 [Pseudomonadota bacterium]
MPRLPSGTVQSLHKNTLDGWQIYELIHDRQPSIPWPVAACIVPRLAQLTAERENCGGPLGWPSGLWLLRLSGYPHDWPAEVVTALDDFLDALFRRIIEETSPYRLDEQKKDIGFIDDLITMVVGAEVPLAPLLDRLLDVPEAARARTIARWTLDECRNGSSDPNQCGFEAMAAVLAASTFCDAEAMDVTKCWLVLQEPWVMIPRALERETEPEWQDVLDEAATLWAAAARDGREGRAVSPWRSRSRYLRRYRRKRRRRSGRGPTTG